LPYFFPGNSYAPISRQAPAFDPKIRITPAMRVGKPVSLIGDLEFSFIGRRGRFFMAGLYGIIGLYFNDPGDHTPCP